MTPTDFLVYSISGASLGLSSFTIFVSWRNLRRMARMDREARR